jgi:hypothetical protein
MVIKWAFKVKPYASDRVCFGINHSCLFVFIRGSPPGAHGSVTIRVHPWFLNTGMIHVFLCSFVVKKGHFEKGSREMRHE